MNVNSHWRSLIRILLAACAHIGGAEAAGLEHARLLSEYTHRAWTARDGAPTQIHSIRQSPDGRLWLSASTGLYRFDGVNFERRTEFDGQPLQSGVILSLDTTSDGSTWIGYRFGGISRFKDGQVRHFGAKDGFPSGLPLTFATAPDGTIWATTTAALAWLADGRWHRVGPETGFLPGANGVQQVMFDHAGTQWVSTANGPYFRRAGATRFRPASPGNVRPASVVVAPNGSVWGSDGNDSTYRLTASDTPFIRQRAAPDFPGSGVAFDRKGTMWLSRRASVERVLDGVASDPRQRITLEQGLSGLTPQAFFEDREGNIWIGTAAGLDQFRPNRVVPLPMVRDMAYGALAADSNGEVWVGDSELQQFGYRLDVLGRQREMLRSKLIAAATDRDGHAILATEQGIWRTGPQGRRLIPFPVGMPTVAPELSALAEQPDGTLWAAFIGAGVYRHRDAAWQAMRPALPTLPDARAMSMLADQAGRVWIGYVNNRIARIDGGVPTLLGAAQGLAVGNVQCIYQRNGHVWVAGDAGVAWYDGVRFVPLRPADGRDLHGISGIVETAGGELWLHGHEGAFRFAAVAVRAFLSNGTAPGYELLGVEDGLSAANSPVGPFPSMVEASDKRLWLASNRGPVWISPGQLRRDARPPLVELRSVESNGKRYDHAGTVVLPTGANNLHIVFSAVTLSEPERTQFRYKLNGVDREWQSAGGRREAFYTNLGPGDYRFQVIAANRDGVWNSVGATLPISIPPTFVQTNWFKLMCVLALVALIAAIYRWRIAQLARLIEARQRERFSERERIARALHDTFLQEAQGSIIMMHSTIRQLPALLPERKALERGIGYMQQALVEGRNEVMGLRDVTTQSEPLAVALEHLGQRLVAGLPISFRVEQHARACSFSTAVRDELFAIGREAIVNAVRHADAAEIVVRLRNEAGLFTMSVHDDGRGYPPEVLAQGGRIGHWGLAGMRERAAKIDATLETGNNVDRGAFLRLVMKAMPTGRV